VFEYVFVLLAACLLLAVVCALFGDEVHAKRGQVVLRELLRVLGRRDVDEDEK
jgi:hypothetical protein